MSNEDYCTKTTKESVKLGLTILTLVLGMAGIIYKIDRTLDPKIIKVQKGYISPSKLEIVTKDLDHNGINETYLEYKVAKRVTDSYQLLEKKDRIIIRKYRIKPAEIISE